MIVKNTSAHITLDHSLTDLVKFLSCLMIALHHYSQGMVVAGTHNPIYQLFSTQGGWLGVAIFFFLSGYGLMKSDIKNHFGIISFFRKRLLRTYLPAVIVSLIWSIYLFSAEGRVDSLYRILYGIIWDFNDEVLWFVRAIIKLYIAFYAYRCLVFRFPKFRLLSLLVVTILALLWIGVGLVHGSSVILFFIGMSIAEYDTWYLMMIRKIYPVIVLFVSIISLSVVLRHDAEWIHLMINYFLISFAVVFLSTYNIKFPSLPQWIGDMSYAVYLVHNKALVLLRSSYAIVPLWIFTVLTIAFTILFYYILKLIKL